MREWINRKFGINLKEEDLKSIKDFSLVWNIFEGYICQNNFSIPQIEQKLKQRNLQINLFEPYLNYFKNRYVENNALNYRFPNLHFRANDRKELVEQVLLGNNNNTNDNILAIVIIVYRFRNNLFHGLKNIEEIDKQKENFENANNFLTTLIDNF